MSSLACWGRRGAQVTADGDARKTPESCGHIHVWSLGPAAALPWLPCVGIVKFITGLLNELAKKVGASGARSGKLAFGGKILPSKLKFCVRS